MTRYLVAAIFAAIAWAHDPITTKLTWSGEVSRLVYRHCGSCHRPGGSAPMSLLDYATARPWAKAIKEEVLERRMPPWNAVKGFGEFADERALSWEDIHQIADWVEGGAPEGDPALLPARPEYPIAEKEPNRTGMRAAGSVVLRSPIRLTGIRAVDVPKGGTLRAIARRKDGSVEPLLWIHNFEPRFARTYFYRTPPRLEAGTEVEVTPAGAGAVMLIY